jgi:hypothetical protein
MGSFATGEINKFLDAITGRTNYTASAAMYAQLHTGDPGSAGTSNVATNSTRQAITFGSAASAGSIANTAAIVWTAVGTAETYTWISLWTASSGGTFLGRDDLSASAAVTAPDSFTIPIGSLVLSGS